MSRVRWAATIGVATGIVGLVFSAVPTLAALEDSVGLPLLFFVRGGIQPPQHVAVVSIDEAAATRLGLPASVRDWPRSTHAALVDRLVERGASAIAFDIQFFRHGAAEADRAFADAIARSRRVVLVQRLEVSHTGDVEHWERQEPIPVLAGQALGLAPVPMPDISVVSWTWSFLGLPNGDEVPTLPAVMLQARALPVTGDFLDIMARAGVDGLDSLPRTADDVRQPADLLRLMQVLRRQIRLHASAASRRVAEHIHEHGQLSEEHGRLLLALVELYSESDVQHLNFYGPPGSICTIPYDVVLNAGSGSSCQLEGAVVFVGLGAARVSRSGLPDTYHAVYAGSDGVDFSGVEIHATAFANLLSGTPLRRPGLGAMAMELTLVGFALGGTAYWVRTRRRWTKGAARCRVQAAAAGAALAVVYCGVVYVVFRQSHVLLPLIVPLIVQLPAGLVLALLAPPARHREQVRAVVLATDAGGSTAVGQRLPHGPYAQLMDDYLQMLLKAVRAHGGEPVPPEGDGLICVWRCPSADDGAPGAGEETTRLRACKAAVDIAEETERFNSHHPQDQQLPTRIGLNVGTITVYSDADRGVFEVFGDTINIAARLRDLTREVGRRVLASAEVTKGLEAGLLLRNIQGDVSLKGVSRSPTVLELTGIGPMERRPS
jgi:adenylate cyclase